MPINRRNRTTIAAIERDRRSLELRGIRNAAGVGRVALEHARAAWKTRREAGAVVQAVRDVLRGNERLHLPGITPVIAGDMLASHLSGRRRTLLVASPQLRARETVKLAGTVYDEAIDFLKERLKLTDDELRSLRSQYDAAALRVTGEFATGIERRVQATIIKEIATGATVRDGVRALRDAFESEGALPDAPYRLEAVFRTQTQMAYSAGRWNSLQDPAVQEILWGFEYVAIEDDRTTELCQSLDGTKLPKDDPFWQRYTPPNHYNCRSTTIEVFDHEDAEATPVPDASSPDRGFDLNFGQVFADDLETTVVAAPA